MSQHGSLNYDNRGSNTVHSLFHKDDEESWIESVHMPCAVQNIEGLA